MPSIGRVVGKALRGAAQVAVPAALAEHQARLDRKAAEAAHRYRMIYENQRTESEAEQSALDREARAGEAAAQRTFVSEESALDREARAGEAAAQRTFVSEESALDREARANEASLNRQQTNPASQRNPYISVPREVLVESGTDEFGDPKMEKIRVTDIFDTRSGEYVKKGDAGMQSGSPAGENVPSTEARLPTREAAEDAMSDPELRELFFEFYGVRPEDFLRNLRPQQPSGVNVGGGGGSPPIVGGIIPGLNPSMRR